MIAYFNLVESKLKDKDVLNLAEDLNNDLYIKSKKLTYNEFKSYLEYYDFLLKKFEELELYEQIIKLNKIIKMIKPIGKNILVKRYIPKEQKGTFITQNINVAVLEFVVIELGSDTNELDTQGIKKGSTILAHANVGLSYNIDGEEFRFIETLNVLGLKTKEQNEDTQ